MQAPQHRYRVPKAGEPRQGPHRRKHSDVPECDGSRAAAGLREHLQNTFPDHYRLTLNHGEQSWASRAGVRGPQRGQSDFRRGAAVRTDSSRMGGLSCGAGSLQDRLTCGWPWPSASVTAAKEGVPGRLLTSRSPRPASLRRGQGELLQRADPEKKKQFIPK